MTPITSNMACRIAIVLVAATLSLAGVALANAATITNEFNSLKISGEIKEGDDEQFKNLAKWLAENTEIVVVLDGPGGAFIPAINIAEVIKANHWQTMVPADTFCMSACAFIWLAGTPRHATRTSMIGFHRVYLTNQDKSFFQEDPIDNGLLGRYLGSVGLGYAAVEFIIKAGPEQMTLLTAEDAAKYKITFVGTLPLESSLQDRQEERQKKADNYRQYFDSRPVNPPEQKSDVVAVVMQDLMLRASPDPQAPNVLTGFKPDYLPTGTNVSLAHGRNSSKCVMNIDGGHWCQLFIHINGTMYYGWSRSWYLMLRDGNRVGCKWAHDIFCG